MSCYLRVLPDSSRQVWVIDDNRAFRVGILNPERCPGCYYESNSNETIWQVMQRLTPWFEPDGRNPFQKTVLQPGQFYPRMARPSNKTPTYGPGSNPNIRNEANSIAIARGQLTTLLRQLDRICQTVHPSEETFNTFGHDIRNLLILLCTEVETQWRGVLYANAVTKKHFDTRDYVHLADAMKLGEYAVVFPSYPWLAPLAPFKDWGSGNRPTKELSWYSAYNAVKHNRETDFKKATLFSVFEAIAACFIMMAAQFGLPARWDHGTELQSSFYFSSVPDWPISELYIFPDGQKVGWLPVNFNFKTGHGRNK